MSTNRAVPITDEVRVLKYMRVQSGFSLKKAAIKLNMTDGAISHIENGKMRLPLIRIEQMVAAYGFTMTDFFTLSRAKKLPNDRREECARLLRAVPLNRLDEVFNFFKTIGIGG